MSLRSRLGVAGSALLLVVVVPTLVAAVQTFPDPFGGEGIHSDIRSGSKGDDIGDAFFLRDDDVLRIRLFLDAPNTFIESHVCLSAGAFTDRIPPGQCQYQEQGAASDTYDISLPPTEFPSGTIPFSNPLGAFCAQVHIAYTAPGLATTEEGGGSAFAGWQSGKPFYGSFCFPPVPDPEPPGEGTAIVEKSGAFSNGEVIFTVTASNPTTEVAADVIVWDALPPTLTWTLPPECSLGPLELVARCDIGDMAGGDSIDLVFTATPDEGVCGTFGNHAFTFVGRAVASSAAVASVDVPCPPNPPADPLILLTKEPSTTLVTAPGTITYLITFENAGPGVATDVTAVDELPAGPEWSIGSGVNVCSISGTTLTCFAETVPDGVFEVLEITGTVDATDCGSLDNQGTVTFSGGPQPGSVTATSPTVEVTGCAPATPAPSPSPSPETGAGGGESGGGELPDTRIPPTGLPAGALAVLLLVVCAGMMVRWSTTRRRSRSRRSSPSPTRPG
jgi:uncharacterized repeat protein (TIGR01451 family)